jgi:hypothetical protein
MAQSSTRNTVLAVLGLGAGAVLLYEAFAPKTVTTEYGNTRAIAGGLRP